MNDMIVFVDEGAYIGLFRLWNLYKEYHSDIGTKDLPNCTFRELFLNQKVKIKDWRNDSHLFCLCLYLEE